MGWWAAAVRRVVRRGWVISPIFEGAAANGGVHALSHDDVTHDGMRDLLVGRDDGTLEVWSFDLGPQPKLIFERSLRSRSRRSRPASSPTSTTMSPSSRRTRAS